MFPERLWSVMTGSEVSHDIDWSLETQTDTPGIMMETADIA